MDIPHLTAVALRGLAQAQRRLGRSVEGRASMQTAFDLYTASNDEVGAAEALQELQDWPVDG